MSAVYTIFSSPNHDPVPELLPVLIVTPHGRPQQILYTYLHTNYNRENYLLTPSPQGDLCVAKLFPPPTTQPRPSGGKSSSEGHGSAAGNNNSHPRTVKCEASRNFRWSITNSGVLTPTYKCTLPADDSPGGMSEEQPLFQISKTNPSSPFWTMWYYAYAGHLIPPKRIQFGHISKTVTPDGKAVTGGGTRVTISGKTEDEKAVWKTLGDGNEDMVEWAVICAALHVLDDEIVKAAEAAGIRIGVLPGSNAKPPHHSSTPPPMPHNIPKSLQLHPTGQTPARAANPPGNLPLPEGRTRPPQPMPPHMMQQQQMQQQLRNGQPMPMPNGRGPQQQPPPTQQQQQSPPQQQYPQQDPRLRQGPRMQMQNGPSPAQQQQQRPPPHQQHQQQQQQPYQQNRSPQQQLPMSPPAGAQQPSMQAMQRQMMPPHNPPQGQQPFPPHQQMVPPPRQHIPPASSSMPPPGQGGPQQQQQHQYQYPQQQPPMQAPMPGPSNQGDRPRLLSSRNGPRPQQTLPPEQIPRTSPPPALFGNPRPGPNSQQGRPNGAPYAHPPPQYANGHGPMPRIDAHALPPPGSGGVPPRSAPPVSINALRAKSPLPAPGAGSGAGSLPPPGSSVPSAFDPAYGRPNGPMPNGHPAPFAHEQQYSQQQQQQSPRAGGSPGGPGGPGGGAYSAPGGPLPSRMSDPPLSNLPPRRSSNQVQSPQPQQQQQQPRSSQELSEEDTVDSVAFMLGTTALNDMSALGDEDIGFRRNGGSGPVGSAGPAQESGSHSRVGRLLRNR